MNTQHKNTPGPWTVWTYGESAKAQAHNLGVQWLGSSQALDWQAHQVISKATS